jgi:DNA (cytosine-5)-methyltransferase 1
MKILNLYACLGGNRYKWGDEHQITAVELDRELARMYQERFPNDLVIVADAHQYLLDHYKEYDFIWTSPPCPTHSRVRFTQKNQEFYQPVYPEMSLYQEIIFLENHFDGKYVVENVIPYYEPLIPGKVRGRHIYWTNFNLPAQLSTRKKVQMGLATYEVDKFCEFHEIDLSSYKGDQRKDKIARNLVDYEDGRIILNTAMGVMENSKSNQLKISI